jgi:hypothetical protein
MSLSVDALTVYYQSLRCDVKANRQKEEYE